MNFTFALKQLHGDLESITAKSLLWLRSLSDPESVTHDGHRTCKSIRMICPRCLMVPDGFLMFFGMVPLIATVNFPMWLSVYTNPRWLLIYWLIYWGISGDEMAETMFRKPWRLQVQAHFTLSPWYKEAQRSTWYKEAQSLLYYCVAKLPMLSALFRSFSYFWRRRHQTELLAGFQTLDSWVVFNVITRITFYHVT